MNIENKGRRAYQALSVSVVVYRPDRALLALTLASLATACERLRKGNPSAEVCLSLVDNGGLANASEDLFPLLRSQVACTTITGHGNIGFGAGHNLAIDGTTSEFHLVLNPDIDIERDALVIALDFMKAHPEVGLLSPRIGDENHDLQYLCRRYPTVLDLFVRGFMPDSVKRLFRIRLEKYEMRDVINESDVVWDPLIVSGCFMLFRTEVLRALGGFDKRYFLYFEDYDLSIRAHDVSKVTYVPQVRILHHGGDAARKGWLHVRLFCSSAFRFFRRFGWKLW